MSSNGGKAHTDAQYTIELSVMSGAHTSGNRPYEGRPPLLLRRCSARWRCAALRVAAGRRLRFGASVEHAFVAGLHSAVLLVTTYRALLLEQFRTLNMSPFL